MRLILASASPRRRELVGALGFGFEVVPSSVDEDGFGGGRPEALARRIARAKALDVASQHPDAVVLAADTIVVLRGAVLNKPRDAREAREMLTSLRGSRHRVITAVCVVAPQQRTRLEHVITAVQMRAYEAGEIEASIARGDLFDKAGAYAIQDRIFAPVESYEGCYCNVVGLPLPAAARLLEAAGLSLVAGITPSDCDACFMKPKSETALC